MTNEPAGSASKRGQSASGIEGAVDDLRNGTRPNDEPGAADEEFAAADANGEDAAACVDRLERRVATLESELAAVRGLLGGVEAVDEAIERRASIALAKAEALEREFAADEPGVVSERLAGRARADSPSDSAPATGQHAPRATASTEPGSADQSAVDPRESSPSAAPADRDAAAAGDDGLAARLRSALR